MTAPKASKYPRARAIWQNYKRHYDITMEDGRKFLDIPNRKAVRQVIRNIAALKHQTIVIHFVGGPEE